MAGIMRGMPSLQRKLVYIVAAFLFSFLVYLLLTNNVYHIKKRDDIANQQGGPVVKKDIILNAIKTLSNKTEDGNKKKPSRDNLVHDNKEDRNSLHQPGDGNVGQRFHAKNHQLNRIKDKHRGKIAKKTEMVKSTEEHHKSKAVPVERVMPPLANMTGPYSGPKNSRQQAVVEAFMHAWNGYKKHAWGHDELKPLSQGWKEWFGCGLTIVDSLDTIWIMGLKDEFRLGRDWVANSLSFNRDIDVQLFEIVIRELGGLMSAYHLSNDKVFLDKAIELSDKLYPCLKGGPSKVPCNRINIKRMFPRFVETSTAEAGTIQLEFRAVSRASNDPKYEDAVMGISEHLHRLEKLDGLVACFLSSQSGMFRMSSTVSMGASADSYYEYLLKQWIQTGKKHDWLRDDYLEAMEGMKKHLLRYTKSSKLAFVGALHSMSAHQGIRSEMEHLACFLPGTLALGYMHGLGGEDHLDMAKDLGRTCYEMYHRMPTGLSPEIAAMNTYSQSEDISVNYGASFNLQRPETIESLFYLYRATKDNKYRDWGWEIFQSFEKYTRVPSGYASVDNVRNPQHVGHRDKMETFYLAETLKYLYLLFSDDPELLPLDKFVINTEAHPLPVYNH